MSDWEGLRYWNTGKHGKTAIDLWKNDSHEELRAQLLEEMRWNYSSQETGVVQYTDDAERANSINAIQRKKTNYEESDVDYFINDYGFRGDWKLGVSDGRKSIGFFGCSFTFGIGLPECDMFTHFIAQHLDCQPYNFGVPGGSMKRATRYYSLVSKYQQFDYVVFLVPHTGRIEIPRADDVKKVMNVIPNWLSSDKKEEERRSRIYSVLDDDFFEYDTLQCVSQCMQIAKANNTKIYFSSWDMPTYDLLYNFLDHDSEKLLPWFEAYEYTTQSNLARDGAHPGPYSHAKFFQRSRPYLK